MNKVRLPVAAAAATLLVATLGAGSLPASASPTPSATTHVASAQAAPIKGAAKGAAKAQGQGRYKVPTGAYFNDPRGNWTAQSRIENQVMRAINATKKGATIRIALFSFDRIPVANALIAAVKRGAHLEMLLNDHQDTKAMKMVRAVIGTDRDKKSFIYKCKESCMGPAVPNRYLHTKFYTFTKTGGSKDALFFGSHNLTKNAMVHQWNDLYLMDGDAALFDNYVALFDYMKTDFNSAQPTYPTFCGIPANGVSCDDAVDNGTTVVFPRVVGPKNDPVVQILNKVQCLTTLPDGTVQRTKLAVSMHTIRGRRGDYLADAYRRKFAEGCQARFSFGLVGAETKNHLGAKTARGRLPLRSTGFDYHPERFNTPSKDNPEDKLDLKLDYYSHQKYLVIQGNYAGNPNANLVFTGSSNWGSLGAVNDEILVGVLGKKVARQYMQNFNFEWRPGNSRNAYTTTYLHFKAADGVATRVKTIDPRFVYHKHADYGPYWEND